MTGWRTVVLGRRQMSPPSKSLACQLLHPILFVAQTPPLLPPLHPLTLSPHPERRSPCRAPVHLMRRSDAGDGTYVPRIFLDRDGIVLGVNSMMGHDAMFDMEEARVGISESDCVYVRLAHGHGGGAASSSAVASTTALGGAPVNEDDHRICASNRC